MTRAEELFAQRRYLGQPVARVEDGPLLTGSARFLADLRSTHALEAAFVRSPVAHGRIAGIDLVEARRQPGVHGVFIAEDMPVAPITDKLPFKDAVKTPRFALAKDKVRFVGEPVVLVVADDRYLAEDAAEQIALDIDALPAVTDVTQQEGPDSVPLFDDAPENVYYRKRAGTSGVEEGFARADHVYSRTIHTNRYIAGPMEGRGILADVDSASGELTCWLSTQSPHSARQGIAAALGLPDHRVRVIAPEVGGAFGMKNVLYPEDLSVVSASRLLGRPVRWVEDRYEHLVGSAHGKEQVITVEVALTAEGRILAMRGRFIGDAGAYSFSQVGGLIECMISATAFPGPYDFGEYAYEVIGALTNKAPVAACRGVGWTAAQTVREVVLDEIAREFGFDRVELRRKNLIRSDQFPYESPSGLRYDSGSNHQALDLALELSQADALEQERQAAKERGKLLGFGISPFVEMTAYGLKGEMRAGVPLRSHDNATVLVEPSGRITVSVGTSAHGQGHRTTFGQLVADMFSVEPSQVAIVEGDTAQVPFGMGTFGSRSAVFGGGAIMRAAVKVRERMTAVAGHMLEASGEDLQLTDGSFRVRGDLASRVSFAEVANAAYFDTRIRELFEDPLPQATAFYDAPTTYPNGCFCAVVEVDAETGAVDLVRAAAVDDCGTIINPTIVDGQILGGFAQGVGGALLERIAYDPETAQALTTTYLDYLVPQASDLCPVALGHIETPSPDTVAGVKGMAEGGAIGAPAAVINAVMDALAGAAPGARLQRLPLTPAVVWETLQAAQA